MSAVKVEQDVKERIALLAEQTQLMYQQIVILLREIDRINKIIGYENVIPLVKKEIK